ncbi:MAG TPA: threonine-phosphate decarboxylase [Prolixibacteraceae bacterium]|nr:threonine-phosphate decarboxylase [Prolixibacteraceae bacterium]
MITGHGDDRHQYSKAISVDFSSNVWFGGISPELIAHLQKNMHLIERYPEPDAAELCCKIAAFHKVDSTQVSAFNGSVEAFYAIALAFREADSAILYPGFAEYEDACRMHKHQLQFFRKEEWEQTLETNTGLIWFGNPNNPDGHIFEIQEIKQAIESFPNTVFIVDEAYADFIPEFQSAIPLTKTYPNLIVVRSLTKCCAIPGLRLGYVVASEQLATKLKQFQQPWSVNALAQEAGKFLLNPELNNRLDAEKVCALSADLQKGINQLERFRVIPSKAPFFLIEIQAGSAAELKQFLLAEHGILIRDASNFRGLNERFFRVCTRNEGDNQLLAEGLRNYSKVNKHRA